jgi:CheY-like chemotaxis protein
MTRLLGIVAIYFVMFLAWKGARLFLLFAPQRAGNLIHESFGLYPQVRRTDHGRKVLLQLAGLALLAFAIRFAFRVVSLVVRDIFVIAAHKILVVDDQDIRRRELHASLYADGFDVTDVEHLGDALAISRIMQFDAVLLRIGARQGSESRACRLLLRDLAHTAIVVPSESNDSSRKVETFEAGADDYLVRPFRHEELVARFCAARERPSGSRMKWSRSATSGSKPDAGSCSSLVSRCI